MRAAAGGSEHGSEQKNGGRCLTTQRDALSATGHKEAGKATGATLIGHAERPGHAEVAASRAEPRHTILVHPAACSKTALACAFNSSTEQGWKRTWLGESKHSTHPFCACRHHPPARRRRVPALAQSASFLTALRLPARACHRRCSALDLRPLLPPLCQPPLQQMCLPMALLDPWCCLLLERRHWFRSLPLLRQAAAVCCFHLWTAEPDGLEAAGMCATYSCSLQCLARTKTKSMVRYRIVVAIRTLSTIDPCKKISAAVPTSILRRLSGSLRVALAAAGRRWRRRLFLCSRFCFWRTRCCLLHLGKHLHEATIARERERQVASHFCG